ncbi:competence/damage-inducible protein A [Roseateles sp. DB2]|uniref:competence/damage-inducible protein A n=1 Tax=Roseateles sp. DB2 TaxID=3453717 RepID=UPI003EEFD4FB
MRVGLIIVGDEILSGKRQDKHLAACIERLQARGMSLTWARYIGDDREAQTAVFREAFASGDLVFSCGGIGATPDDHSRQAAAAALARPLVLHPEARALIWQRIQEVAQEQGSVADEQSADTLRRFQMGEFPEGAGLIPNPYNRIPGFYVGDVHFVPGFPVMAHPMMEWVLDTRYPQQHRALRVQERSVVLPGALEATLTPLMLEIEARFPGIKVFSLPSVDHPQWGRHVELGVKGDAAALDAAFEALKAGLSQIGANIGTELVR